MEGKDLFILQNQYHGFWWPGDARSQVISSHGIDPVIIEYSGFNTRRVNLAEDITGDLRSSKKSTCCLPEVFFSTHFYCRRNCCSFPICFPCSVCLSNALGSSTSLRFHLLCLIRNGCQFEENFLNAFSWNEMFGNFIQISHKFIPNASTDNKSALVYAMTL